MHVTLLHLALAAAPETAWQIDLEASALTVRVYKDTSSLAASLAHDHVMAASGWSATLRTGGGAGCSAEVRVPVRSLEVDPPELRTRLGMGEGPSEGQRGEIRESMLGGSQLDAANHPTIAFATTSCDTVDGGLEVHGKLSIRGATRDVTIPMRVTTTGGHLAASGSFSIRATDFGFEPYSAVLGTVRNRDEMRFDLVIHATEAP